MNEYYLNSLKDKYNYDDKTIRALEKIIPALIEYYGKQYERIILEAILSCRIIPCSVKETISKIKKRNILSEKYGVSDVASIEIKGSEVSYISDCKIEYNEEENKYYIADINRVIATSHAHNYDSPKGLEILVYGLCKLIKSYNNEFTIDENILVKRTGFDIEKRKIDKLDDEIFLNLLSHEGHGLSEGFNIYDTSKITSLILKDDYKCYDYDSIYTIARVLKEKFNLKEEINYDEIEGKEIDNPIIEDFKEECDICLFLENEMFISITREDKDELAQKINDKLNKDIFDKLISIYENINKQNKVTM